MEKFKLTISYQGTQYAGWQLQAKQGVQPRTIQGELEKALRKICGKRIVVHGAGRTDSGVHAEAQICHIELPKEYAMRCLDHRMDLRRALNGNLPLDIRVLDVVQVAPSFHARKCATKKVYAYSLWTDNLMALPRVAPFAWSTKILDISAMEYATQFIIGTKDFAVFQKKGTEMESTVRTVFSLSAKPHYLGPFQCPTNWPVTTWFIEGDGFLRQMVRNIMGLLVWVGLGKIDPNTIAEIIATTDRTQLPSPAAPSHGLTLYHVTYEE